MFGGLPFSNIPYLCIFYTIIFPSLQLKMKITDFENRRSFKSIWLNSQFREEVRSAPMSTTRLTAQE